jgi:hypothetical protein
MRRISSPLEDCDLVEAQLCQEGGPHIPCFVHVLIGQRIARSSRWHV